jgi:hypothetical protein
MLNIEAHHCYGVHRKYYASIFSTTELQTWTKCLEIFSVDLDVKDHDRSRVLHSSSTGERIVTRQGISRIMYRLQEYVLFIE